MTLSEIAALDKPTISPEQAAQAVGYDPQTIRLAARTPEGRSALGFPVIRAKSRTRIPRIPFLEFMGWKSKS